MKLKQYLQLFKDKRSEDQETSCETMKLVEDALGQYPNSYELLNLRGDLIQLGSVDIPYELSDALVSYQKAVEVNPNFSEGFESIGYYYDVIDIKLDLAEEAFRKAIELEDRLHSYLGLGRVMSERGEPKENLNRICK